MIVDALKKVSSGRHLTAAESADAFMQMMNGENIDHVVAGALLTALAMNRPNAEEVIGAATAMRAVALRISAPEDAVDIVGTGGDGLGTFNCSTTAAFVAAGAGVTIAKHGNRASTSQSGSADCLAALGYNLLQDLADVERSIAVNGIGFCFANRCHPAMKHIAPVRRALPFRTIFNLVGPLSNPAGVRRYALGVCDQETSAIYIEALKTFKAKKALVFTGPDGLDELGLSGVSHVAELDADGNIREYEFDPKRIFGRYFPIEAIKGGTSAQNAAITLGVINGSERGAFRFATLANAAAAIVAGGKAATLEEGVRMAEKAIDSCAAVAKLSAMVAGSRKE